MFRNARHILIMGGTFNNVECDSHCCNCRHIRPGPVEPDTLREPSTVCAKCSNGLEAQDDASPNSHLSVDNSSSVCRCGQNESATHPPESTGASVSQPEPIVTPLVAEPVGLRILEPTSNTTNTTTERLEVPGVVRIHATRAATIEVIPSSPTIQPPQDIFSNADVVVQTSDSYIKIKLA